MSTTTETRFARVPLDFLFALERGEITLDQWAVGAFLVGRVDYIRNEVSYTLRGLADACGWRKSSEALRQVVTALRDGGWIHYESVQGQRSPYVFSLGRLHRKNSKAAPQEDVTSYWEGADERTEPWR